MQGRAVKSPARMVRKQLLLTKEQNERLRRHASSASRAESELVREAIDEWLARNEAAAEDWKSGLLAVAGLWADYPQIDQVMAEGRDRRRARRKRLLEQMRRE